MKFPLTVFFTIFFFCATITVFTASLFAAPLITIENITNVPNPFSPDADGADDFVIISAVVGASGFNSTKLLTAACSVAVTDINGNAVATISQKITLADNTKAAVSFQWDGKNKRGNVVGNGDYPYSITVTINKQAVTVTGGTITLFIPPVLSVSVSPGSWDIGQAEVNSIVTMSKSQGITVTNNGNSVTTYSLNLINPAGLEVSQISVGKDTYILNAAFSRDLRKINWSEDNHALSLVPVLCSDTQFAGDQTGVSVQPGTTRTLWLQFKSPSSITDNNKQEMEVVITASPE